MKTQTLNINQATKFFHCSKATIYRWIADGTLPYVKIGRRVLFLEEDLNKLIAEQRVPSTDEIAQEVELNLFNLKSKAS